MTPENTAHTKTNQSHDWDRLGAPISHPISDTSNMMTTPEEPVPVSEFSAQHAHLESKPYPTMQMNTDFNEHAEQERSSLYKAIDPTDYRNGYQPGQPFDNAQVEQAPAALPPYAYTVNGGMYPYQNPYPYQQVMGIPAQNYPPNHYLEHYDHGFAQPASGASGYHQFKVEQEVKHNECNLKQNTADIFDYQFISSPARIVVYDNLKAAPRVIQVEGAPTHEYIEQIASVTYKSAKEEGGLIPYTVIREVSENFIHAQFREIVVSIMDKGNTIRFADQGPGINNKDLAQEPGFSSATEPMKRYIRGVGSGLPIVKEYLDTTHGYIKIEDNINKGSVVTISLVASRSIHDDPIIDGDLPELTENEQRIIKALLPDKSLGITELNRATGIPVASIHTGLSRMEQQGLVEKVNKKRKLTMRGERVALSI